MKVRVIVLCIPLAVLSAQQNAILMTIPPFLDAQRYNVSLIGALSAIAPLFTLAARVPTGMLYRTDQARMLMGFVLLAVAATSVLYGVANTPLLFALVSTLNGFSGGVATTIYLPFFLDSLSTDQPQPEAMGWYTGSVALGFAVGGYGAGYMADHWGYACVFATSAGMALATLGFLFMLDDPARAAAQERPPAETSSSSPEHSSRNSTSEREPEHPWFRRLLESEVATILATAVFLNMLYKIPATFIPIHALASGLTLTDVGLVMGVYALCNAVIRPLSGPWIQALSPDFVWRVGLPLQAVVLMAVPFCQQVISLLVIAVCAGALRALVMVANTVAMTERMSGRRFTKGMASGFFNAASDVGYILGPLFGGFVAARTGTGYVFVVAPALIAVGFLAAIFFFQRGGSRKVRAVGP